MVMLFVTLACLCSGVRVDQDVLYLLQRSASFHDTVDTTTVRVDDDACSVTFYTLNQCSGRSQGTHTLEDTKDEQTYMISDVHELKSYYVTGNCGNVSLVGFDEVDDAEGLTISRTGGDGSAHCHEIEASLMQVLHPGRAYALYKHAHVLQDILAKSGIPIWANAGTVLGAVRGQGIIPHDNDADFTIFEQDMEKAVNAINSAEGGMTAQWVKNQIAPHVYHGGHIATNDKASYKGRHYHSHIGVFIAEMLELYRGAGSSLAREATKGGAKEKLDFANSLVPIPFGCASVLVPKDKSVLSKYLFESYGSDWNQVVNCAGTMHSCGLSKSAKTRAWELTNKAEPCYEPEGDLEPKVVPAQTEPEGDLEPKFVPAQTEPEGDLEPKFVPQSPPPPGAN